MVKELEGVEPDLFQDLVDGGLVRENPVAVEIDQFDSPVAVLGVFDATEHMGDERSLPFDLGTAVLRFVQHDQQVTVARLHLNFALMMHFTGGHRGAATTVPLDHTAT